MEVGDIVSVVTLSGEYIGELLEDRDTRVLLKNPRMIVQTAEGMGFARGIAITGEENPDTAEFRTVVFVVPSNDSIKSAWKEATNAIITPESKIVV